MNEQIREEGIGSWLRSVVFDCRYALRQLRRNRGVSAIIILTLALGIGAATAIFSVVEGVLLRPLPYDDPGRIMAIFEVNTKGTWSHLADPNFDDFRDQNRSFQSIAKYSYFVASISGATEPTRSVVATVSPDFLKVFRVRPLLGRDFNPADAKKGAAPTVLLSHEYWMQYLGAPRDLSRAHLKIDGTVFSVIGVLPAGFDFPKDVAVWLPADLDGENPSRTSHNAYAVGRLRDGVTVDQANRDISAIATRIHDTSNEQGSYLLKDAVVVPLQDSITGKFRSQLLVLLGAVGFLLLVACANVANLMLAQASGRERELAVRMALGAPRGRLIRQLVTETLLFSLLGGGLGVLGAFWGVRALVALAPENLPRVEGLSINVPVLLFALLLSTFIATALGAFTAARATFRDPRRRLVEGRGEVGARGSHRAGQLIVAAQIAITLALVIGAGLLGRSLMKVLEVNPGFRVDRILTMDISLPWVTDPQAKTAQSVLLSNLIERLQHIPGVQKIGATSGLPMDGGHPDGMFLEMAQSEVPGNLDGLIRAYVQQKERTGVADFCAATDGYFQVLGIPLIRGRMFDRRDRRNAPHVAVVSESLARERWPNQDPIGRTIEFGNMDSDLRLLTIVGVVGDTHEYGLDAPPRPTVYVDLFQRPRPSVTVTMLSDGDPRMINSAARGILSDIDPEIPARFRTLSQVYSASLSSRRFNVVLIGFFAITALLLATAGVFGVMAYSVSRRTREIGVRSALGAAPGDVMKMILSEAMHTILVGVVVGFAASLALTRAVQSLLFGVTATDPLTFGGVTLLLVGAALLASYAPARHAMRVDPTVALRHE